MPAPGGGWDTEVGLDAPLAHAHRGETEVHNGHTLELRAEVGVISRPSIKLAGVDSLASGFKFKTMALTDEGMMLLARGRSVTELSGVLLSDGGCNQGVSVTCKRKGAFVMPLVHVSAKHFAMESCVVIPRRGHGIVARSGVYRNNLVYHSATGFALGGSADARYNVVFSVRDMGKNLDYTDEDAHFGVWSTSSLVLVGNRGACSTGPSYRFSSFNMRPAHFHNNSAHCANLGLTIKGSHTSAVQDITLWRIRHIALWGYVSSDSPTFDNVRLADFSVGLLWGGLGADSAKHTVRMQTVLVSNSLFLGRSTTNPSCFEQVGILLPWLGLGLANPTNPNPCPG